MVRARCSPLRNPRMKTDSIRAQDAQRNWYVVDANGRTLGRLASLIAHRLRGKHKVDYTPHVDAGDYIVVVNAEKVRVTGNKERDKTYYRHTGYPGGIKAVALGKLRTTHPERLLTYAVRGMLPRNRLGRAMLRKLKIYAGPSHPHLAQRPQALEI